MSDDNNYMWSQQKDINNDVWSADFDTTTNSGLNSVPIEITTQPNIPVRRLPNSNRLPSAGDMTEEDIRVVQECRSEAFLYRGLPLAFSASMFTLWRHMQKPFTMPHLIGRICGFTLTGILFGQVLYFPKCKEKIMLLENSTLKNQILRGSQSNGNYSLQHEPEVIDITNEDSSSRKIPEEFQQRTQTDFEQPLSSSARTTYDELQRRNRANFDRPPQDSSSRTTYDELQRRNRANFDRPPQDSSSKITYDELQRRNRANLDNSQDISSRTVYNDEFRQRNSLNFDTMQDSSFEESRTSRRVE